MSVKKRSKGDQSGQKEVKKWSNKWGQTAGQNRLKEPWAPEPPPGAPQPSFDGHLTTNGPRFEHRLTVIFDRHGPFSTVALPSFDQYTLPLAVQRCKTAVKSRRNGRKKRAAAAAGRVPSVRVVVKLWSTCGQLVVKLWSNYGRNTNGQIMAKLIMVNLWSNGLPSY